MDSLGLLLKELYDNGIKMTVNPYNDRAGDSFDPDGLTVHFERGIRQHTVFIHKNRMVNFCNNVPDVILPELHMFVMEDDLK